MKECPSCHELRNDDAKSCECGHVFQEPAEPGPSLGDVGFLATPAQQPADRAPAAAPATLPPPPDSPRLQIESEHVWQDHRPAPPAPPPPPPTPPPTPPPPPPSPPEPQQETIPGPESDLTPAQLKRIARSRRFVIGLIGYPESGKTWFLNRLKYRYERNQHEDDADSGRKSAIDGQAFVPYPPAARRLERVERTNATSEHIIVRLSGAQAAVARVEAKEEDGKAEAEAPPEQADTEGEEKAKAERAAERDPNRTFSIIDIPGERFKTALIADLATDDALGLLQAIVVCHALIVMLPSQKLFADGGEDDAIRQSMLIQQRRSRLPPPPEPEVGAIPEELSTAGLEADAAQIEAQLPAALKPGKGRGANAAAAAEAQASPDDKARLERLREIKAEIENRIAWRRAEDAIEIEEFTGSITRLCVTLSVLRSGGVDSAEAYLALPDEEKAEMASEARLSGAPLIYVAFSKADAMLPKSPAGEAAASTARRKAAAEMPDEIPLHCELEMERDELDLQPISTLRQTHGDIYVSVRNSFPWYKFDFLTAFRGQKEEGESSSRINYKAGAWGVDAVIDWIVWAQRYARITGRAGTMNRVLRFLASMLFAPRLETEIARVAAGSPAPRPLWRRTVARLIAPMARNRAKFWGRLGVATLVVVALAAFLVGVPSLFRDYQDTGAYKVEGAARYPIELERIVSTDPIFATGFDYPAALAPWASVPDRGGMFQVQDRDTRIELASILRDIRNLPSGPILPGVGNALVRRLDLAQGRISSSNTYAHRAVVPFHIGYLHLRMEDWPAAERRFKDALDLMSRVEASDNVQRGRLEGVRVAASLGRATALLRLGRVAEAEQILGEQLGVVNSQQLVLRAASDRNEIYDFEVARTLAPFSTAAIWSELAAARIRLHAAAGNESARQAAAAKIQSLIDAFPSHATGELSRHPLLAVNLQIAAVRVGAPLGRVTAFGFANGPQAEERTEPVDGRLTTTSETAVAVAGGRSANCQRGQIWCVTGNWRRALAQGNPKAIRTSRLEYERRLQFSEDDLAFLDQWRSDVLSEARSRPGADRSALIAGYGDMFQGFSRVGRMLDAAPWGPWQGVGLALLLTFFFARIVLLAWRASGSFSQLQSARHYEDRKRWEKKDQEKRDKRSRRAGG